MRIEETFGKIITNIYQVTDADFGGNETAECYIELDHDLIIDIPFGVNDEVWMKELKIKAKSVFEDLSEIPVQYVNKENKSIEEHTERDQKPTLLKKWRNIICRRNNTTSGYHPYKVEYHENRLKNIKNRKIVGFVYYQDETEKGLFLLDNGYLITETLLAPYGTGLAGLNYYENMDSLIHIKGNDYKQVVSSLS